MSNGGGPLEDEAGHMGRWLEVLSKAKSSPRWPKGAGETVKRVVARHLPRRISWDSGTTIFLLGKVFFLLNMSLFCIYAGFFMDF